MKRNRPSHRPCVHRNGQKRTEMRFVMVKTMICPLILALMLAGCQSIEKKRNAPVPVADSIAMRPKIDVRTIRTSLVGKSMREVVKALGQPTTAYTLDEREIWSYEDRAKDSITGRPVRFVEVVFKKRIVQKVDFSF